MSTIDRMMLVAGDIYRAQDIARSPLAMLAAYRDLVSRLTIPSRH